MTAVLAPPAALPVRVVAADEATRATLTSALRGAGVRLCGSGPAVIAAVGESVEDAIEACAGAAPGLVVAERFSQLGVRRALRLGASAMLRARDLTPDRLLAAVDAARSGDGRVPHEVLVRLLGGPEPVEPTSAVLTRRQTSVLGLMADGHGNADIARMLECSEHTVKNVIYELMGRLQARNRSHAVATAIRTGLI